MKWPDDFINKVICGDCLEILPLIPDGVIDAVITDPPYGIRVKTDWKNRRDGAWAKGDRPLMGDDRPFDHTALLKNYYEKTYF